MSERNVNRRPARPARPAGRGWFASADHRYAAAKWALLAALAVYSWLVIGLHSTRDVAFSTVEAAFAPAVVSLERMDENAFQERFGIPPEGCEGWLLYGAEEIMNVSEVMIAKAGEDALDRLEDAVRGRIDAQLSVFEGYGAEQTALLRGATVLRRGSWLFYGVGEEADRWEDALLSAIR